jgi:hypothetical protein
LELARWREHQINLPFLGLCCQELINSVVMSDVTRLLDAAAGGLLLLAYDEFTSGSTTPDCATALSSDEAPG